MRGRNKVGVVVGLLGAFLFVDALLTFGGFVSTGLWATLVSWMISPLPPFLGFLGFFLGFLAVTTAMETIVGSVLLATGLGLAISGGK